MQLRLLFPAPQESPPPAQPYAGTWRVLYPAWYQDDVPDDAEMCRRASLRDEALSEWQQACAAFDLLEPPLPVRWSNWQEANEREKRKAAYTKIAHQRLDDAREAYARGICLQARRDDKMRKAFSVIGDE